MAKNLEVALKITAQDSTAGALSRTRAGLESISRQLAIARNAWLSLQGAIGLQAGLSGLAEMADRIQSVNARLRLAVATASDFAQAQQAAARIAAQSGASYEAVASLYARLATAGRSFGLSQQQIEGTVQSTALALRVSGATAAETASVITQLSQALGSGVLRGEEFNAIMENGGRLAQALADGLGLPVGRLRELAEQGLLTTDVVVRALQSQRAAIEADAAAMPRTVGQAMQGLRDQFGRFIDEANRASGATGAIAAGIDALARNIAPLASGAAVAGVAALTAALVRAGQAGAAYAAQLWARIAAERQAAVTAQAVAAHEVAKAQAMLASAQAAVANATGMARLTAVQTQLVPAQQRLAAAQAALNAAMAGGGIAAGVASRALGLLGGPLGAVLTLLSAGATAWAIWGGRASEAANQASEAIERAREVGERLRREQRFGGGDAGALREGIAALEARERELLDAWVESSGRAATKLEQRIAAVRAELAQRRRDLTDLQRQERQVAGQTEPTALGREVLGRRFAAFVDQYRKRLDPLAAALQELREEAQKAGIALESPQFREAEAIVRRAFASKRPAADVSAFDAELAALRLNLKAAEDLLEASFKARLVSEDAYWRAKGEAQRRALDLEQRELQARIAEQEQTIAALRQAQPRDDEQRQDIAGRIATAQNRIAELRVELAAIASRRTVVEFEVRTNLDRVRREIDDLKTQLRERAAEATGALTPEQRRAALERQFQDTLARLADDAEGVALVRRVIDVEAARAELSALEAEWRLVMDRMRNAQEAVQIQQQAGFLTEAQARRQIVDLQREAAGEMQRLLPLLAAAAQALGPEAVARVQAWRNELERTRMVADDLAPLWSGIGQAFGQALDALVTRTATWRDAMQALFVDVARVFRQEVVLKPMQEWIAAQARMLAVRLGLIQQQVAAEKAAAAQSTATKAAEAQAHVSAEAAKAGAGAAASQASIPIAGPALAIAAMAAMVAAVMALMGKIRRFATGGTVPGHGDRDTVPAMLTPGEYVIRREAVRRVGVRLLDAINGLRVPPPVIDGRLAFAAGGMVPAAAAAPAPAAVPQNVRIVNALDPDFARDWLQSPAGERVILNVIGRNAAAVRNLVL